MDKRFTQMEGVNYNDIFSLMVKCCSIRVLMEIINQFDLEFEHLDIKTTFLHGDIEETIYMEQTEGFVEDVSKICLLKRHLYRLKQSLRQ